MLQKTISRSLALGFGLGLTAAVALAGTARAQEEPEGGGGMGLGIMGFTADTPYGFSVDGAIPFIDFDSRYFRISGPSVDLKLPWVSSDNLSFALRANLFTGEGYKPSDAAILSGMAERKSGIWVGGAMDWTSDIVDLSFEATADTGDSNGSRLKFEASKMYFLGEKVTVKPRLGAIWLDDNAVDYFYGVRAAEATATRAAYTGSSTVNVEAGITFGYMLAERHMLMLDINATKLGSGITDSPIVIEDTLTAIGVGYMFRF